MDFNIKGFISTSMVDWPGKISSVIFLAGCGFRCPACHNRALVLEPHTLPDYSIEDILDQLTSRRDWIDGVTVTGGEPTTGKDLPALLRLLRSCGAKIKVDTNGSNPSMLKHLVSSGLVDAVYMDVKAPFEIEAYSMAAGVAVDPRIIRRSVEILKGSGLETVFRTTVVPDLVGESELEAIRRGLGSVQRFIIQPFRPVDTLNPEFSEREGLPLERFEYLRDQFEIPTRAPARGIGFARAG